MTVKEFTLDKIQANPYQTRLSEDPQHIKDLAISIGEQGMLQIPTGRMGDDGNVQLAFGHSRFAAHKFLTDTGNPGFSTMQINVQELDDLQMFQMAVSENRDRKDLTPIEEAMAMKVYRDKFNKTSEEIGQLFHLSDSAVRNKMRLLELPEDVKKVVGPKLTEGAARELVTFYDLPSEITSIKQYNYKTGNHEDYKQKISSLVEEGASAELLHETISQLVEHAGQDMSTKPWKHTDEFLDEKNNVLKICKGCPALLKREKDYCLEPDCYKAKMSAWQRQYLAQASLISGIALISAADECDFQHATDFDYYGQQSLLGKIRNAKCENLRLNYDQYSIQNGVIRDSDKYTHLQAEGFPGAEIICKKRQGFCTCLNAMSAGLKLDTENGVAGTKEDLKEVNRQKKEQARIDKEIMQGFYDEAAKRFEEALRSTPAKVCMILLNLFDWAKYRELEDMTEENVELKVRAVIAEKITKKDSYDYISDKNVALLKMNERLTIAGLPIIQTANSEVEQ